ncbi:hypothetical protein IMSAGC020_00743 [Lachnospiraceae bacterium]|nr:hypothetical protein IMSAGC020_00743 [Lachnospiraceae bacterium]
MLRKEEKAVNILEMNIENTEKGNIQGIKNRL